MIFKSLSPYIINVMGDYKQIKCNLTHPLKSLMQLVFEIDPRKTLDINCMSSFLCVQSYTVEPVARRSNDGSPGISTDSHLSYVLNEESLIVPILELSQSVDSEIDSQQMTLEMLEIILAKNNQDKFIDLSYNL